MNLSFTETRHRTTYPESSRLAAKTAAGGKAGELRRAIHGALVLFGPMTAREVSKVLNKEYYEVQRRMSETAGIEKTDQMREDCMVWRAIGVC